MKVIIILLVLMLSVPNVFAGWVYYYDEKGKFVGSSETVENINYDTEDKNYNDHRLSDILRERGLLP